MRKSLATALLLVPLVAVTGCRHRSNIVVLPNPPQPQAEKAPVTPMATDANIPGLPGPAQPAVVLGGAVAPAPVRRESGPRPDDTAQGTKDAHTQAIQNAAAGEEPSTATPIGQLSAAPNTQGVPNKATTAAEIRSIQNRLKSIHHALNASEQKTAAQIQTFLFKATNALQAGDLDGAHTLTVKARVLLNELY